MGAATNRTDAARPLTAAGRAEAAAVARRMAIAFPARPRLITSPATRTQETARIIAAAWQPPLPISTAADIYEATVGTLLQLVQAQRDDVQHLVLCGHNPGISGLARYLSTESAPLADLAPCGFMTLMFDVTRWRDVARARGIAAAR